MIRWLSSLAVTFTFGGCVVATCSSCGHLAATPAASATPRDGQAGRRDRVVQHAHGPEAAFGVCVEPKCPKTTPKSLPSSAVAAAPSFDPRESGDPAAPIPVVRAALAQVSQLQASPYVPSASRRLVVTFAFGSAALSPDAKAALGSSTEDAERAERIVISGRTDAIGDVHVNEALALARAHAVRDHLRTLAPYLNAPIAIDAKGRCCFIASNADAAGRAKNRRVEILFAMPGGA